MTEQRTRDVITPETARTLAGLFRERVQRSPGALAYRQYDREARAWRDSTWADMAQAVARCQHALAKENLARGDRVAILLGNSREWVTIDQAALGLGLVVVPLYTDDRAENIAYILQNSGTRVLFIGNGEHWKRLEPVRDELGFLDRIVSIRPVDAEGEPAPVAYDDWAGEEGDGRLREDDCEPDELATIVYTSGTTGRPKGVMLSHHNILWNAWAGQEHVNIYPDDLFLSFLPLSHTFERTVGYYLPMICGAGVAYSRSIPELAEDLVTLRPTAMISVPRIFERVRNKIVSQLDDKPPVARWLFHKTVEVGWQRFEYRQGRASWSPALLAWPLLDKLVASKVMAKLGGRMRVSVCGGAPLPPAVARLFIGLGLPLVQGYGLTESSPVIAANKLEDNVPESIGVPLRDVEVRLGEKDELLARSPGVMLGYWRNPEATAAAIEDGWLHTGDQARIDERGHIYITGRLKEIIVLANGEKVPPADMEQAIASDSLFEQVMVLGENRPFLSALVVLNTDCLAHEARRAGLDPTDPGLLQDKRFNQMILERIGQRISAFPGYAKIRAVRCYSEPWTVDDGLITPTLKLKRNRIEERFATDIEAMYAGH